jgi:hypothetical protein
MRGAKPVVPNSYTPNPVYIPPIERPDAIGNAT